MFDSDELSLLVVVLIIIISKLRSRHSIHLGKTNRLKLFLLVIVGYSVISIGDFWKLIQVKTNGELVSGSLVGYLEKKEGKGGAFTRYCPQVQVQYPDLNDVRVLTDTKICLDEPLPAGQKVVGRIGDHETFLIERPWTVYWKDYLFLIVILIVIFDWKVTKFYEKSTQR